ncbi:MAG: pentapeptide repeat-containing protein [Nostocaceae cyanobacterium]|nr:pentapeptide repeat-containing protein [Nostocaceae cyanobacterium]
MNVEELLAKYEEGLRNFSNVQLSEANLSSAKISEINLSHANLSVVNLSGANLYKANLSHGKLNVARLRGANLSEAILNYASLNVANLIRADLSRAQLKKASLVRAELIRADLSRACLLEANLTSADLREASLRHALLRQANFSEAFLADAILTGANLEQAYFNNTDLSRADLSGINARQTEFQQANLNRANLSGANLSGANLRWADLSGANLRWADLSGAKLSGAILTGADLSHANLTNVSLVHADLTEARLIQAEWIGADLTAATLTGAKLYATSRFGLKTEGMTCEWIDLSPKGDRSIIQYFNSQDSQEFFNQTPPTIRIIVDSSLDHEANFALAGAYYQIAQQYPELNHPPSLEIGVRRTTITFRVESDIALLATAYIAILPLQDAAITQKKIRNMVKRISREDVVRLGIKDPERMKKLTSVFEGAMVTANAIKEMKKILAIAAKLSFFQAPSQTIVTNSSAQSLILYHNPHFGKHLMPSPTVNPTAFEEITKETEKLLLPSLSRVIDFIKGFHYINH